jgi:uncharacterized membrane protein
MNETTPRDMLSIWIWVGIILSVYGFIVTVMGVYYLVAPETTTATASLNASLWWGAGMLACGIVFIFISQKGEKSDKI